MPSSAAPRTALVVAAAGGAVLAGAAAVYELWRRLGVERPPQEWRRVGELSELFLWPIKSCGPVLVTALETTDIGLRLPGPGSLVGDRLLVVTDRNGRFLTARTHPRLTQISVGVDGNVLTLGFVDESLGKVKVDLSKMKSGPHRNVHVWGEDVNGVDCGDEVAAWIQKAIVDPSHGAATAGAEPRLMYYPSKQPCRKGRRGDTGVYSDEGSYMLMTESSLADLNGRMARPVSIRQFRPNFFVKGPSAFEEDNWTWIRIGDKAIFKVFKPCTRCMLTTVDPETGVKSTDLEPLKTLRTYRAPSPELRKKVGDSPILGAMMGIFQKGNISLGDAVYVSA